MKTANRYSGQALAIVMIVLVISLILGMAMLSRVLRDNFRVVSEKSSAEALETVDAVIDALKGTPVTTMKASCAKPQFGNGVTVSESCKVTGTQNVTAYLSDLGINIDSSKTLQNCNSETSTIDVSTKLAGPEDELEIRPDNVRSFVLRGQTPTVAGCTLNLTVESRGSDVSGMMISKVYARNYVSGLPTEFKPYELSDISSYCIFRGADCTSNTDLVGTWTPVASGSQITIPLAASGGYNLDEIRIRSVNSIIAIKSTLSTLNCVKDWEMLKVTVGSNCTGSYRAKEVQIPQNEWALPVFDYVVFNGSGVLKSE